MQYALVAQGTIVSGTVLDAVADFPLPGVSIVIKGTNKGTITDLDGRFSIECEEKETILTVSYLGMRSQEIPASSGSEIVVRLEEDQQLLEEIVVVGYGTQKRSKISGAVSTINAQEIGDNAASRLETALQGKTAGVQVSQNSGSPGSNLNVRIRGIGTLQNADPLYIIDGNPVDGLDFLNPSDVENISVLKDAAAASIYGTRAANGVVLITTKTGKKGQEGKVHYEQYYGIQSVWKKKKLLSAREYAILSNEAHIAAGKVPLPEFSNPDALGEGTDWQDAIFEDAPISNHNLAFYGGNEKSTYGLSANLFNQEGIVGGDKSDFRRATIRMNAATDIKPWLTIGNNLAFTWLKKHILPENNPISTPLIRALNMDPVTPVRRADGSYAYSQYTDTDIANPVNAIERTFDEWITNRAVGSINLEARPIAGLSLRTSLSVDASYARRDIFYPIFDLSINPELGDAPPNEQSDVNTVSREDLTWRNWQWENILSYEFIPVPDHNLGITIGNTVIEQSYDQLIGSNSNLPSNSVEDAYLANTIDPLASQGAGDDANEYALLSYFGRINYDYQDKYLLTASLRRDGSSRFGANNRFGTFPAFSLGWIVSREDFWSNSLIDFLKLRASWGKNGNDRFPNYSFTSVVLGGQNYTFGEDEDITNGSVTITASNPDLRWETNIQTDVGIDMDLFEGKIGFTADYYIRKTEGMIYNPPVPAIVGADPPFTNIGEMLNKGLELALNYRNKGRNFKYSLEGNISFINSEIVALGDNAEPQISGEIFPGGFASRSDVGNPVASFYGYVTDGIFQNQQEINEHAFQSELTAPGDFRFADLNNDGVIDLADQTFIGDPSPDFIYGITGGLEFGGFDLMLFMQGANGNQIFNNTVRHDFFYTNRPQSWINRWTGEGTSNDEPRVNLDDPNNNYRVSDYFIEDGSYLRIKQIQIGYTIPKRITSIIRCEQFKVYVSAQNLWTWTDYSGLDPEIGVVGWKDGQPNGLELGIDKGFYPQARTFKTGISVTF